MLDIPGGYIILARKIRKSPLWLSLKCAHRIVMLEIIMQAQWQDADVVRNGEVIHLKRGQLATSYQHLVDDIADKEVTVKVVRTAIDKLEKSRFLEKDEKAQRAKRGLLLTVDKYGFYQDPDNYKGKADDNAGSDTENSENRGEVRAMQCEVFSEIEGKANVGENPSNDAGFQAFENDQGQSEISTLDKVRAINKNYKELKDLKELKERSLKDMLKTEEQRSMKISKTELTFDDFYSAYPRKVSKQQAMKSWDKLAKQKGFDPALIIRNTYNYADTCKLLGTQPNFILHPSTYLNQKRYEDYPTIDPEGLAKPVQTIKQQKNAEQMDVLKQFYEEGEADEQEGNGPAISCYKNGVPELRDN